MSRDLMRGFNANPISPDTLGSSYAYPYTKEDCSPENLLGIVEHIYNGAIRAAKTSKDRSYTYSLSHTGLTFKKQDYTTILACLQEYFQGCLVELDLDWIDIDWS